MGAGVPGKPTISAIAMRRTLRSTLAMRSSRQLAEYFSMRPSTSASRETATRKMSSANPRTSASVSCSSRAFQRSSGPGRAFACPCRAGRASAWRVHGPCGVFREHSFCHRFGFYFALERDHLNRRSCRFKTLVAHLQACTVERLFQRLAGKDPKGMRDARFLLGLADASRDFVVNGLIVGGFAAQKNAQRNDGIELAGFGSFARSGWDFPCAGDANDGDVVFLCAAAEKSVQRALQEAVGNHSVPARSDDGKAHSLGRKIAFERCGFSLQRIEPFPEGE